jgi:hypothetical protein
MINSNAINSQRVIPGERVNAREGDPGVQAARSYKFGVEQSSNLSVSGNGLGPLPSHELRSRSPGMTRFYQTGSVHISHLRIVRTPAAQTHPLVFIDFLETPERSTPL